MARKKSARLAAQRFVASATEIESFGDAMCGSGLSAQYISWGHDLAIIALYRGFETLMLEALIAAVNNDTTTVSTSTGIAFPKHLTDEVCEFLIIGTGYFDFKGRDGLVSVLKKYVPSDHYLVLTVKKPAYRQPIERLCALRNFAAHSSASSKKAALKAIDAKNLSSSGAWLKRQDRLQGTIGPLKALAAEIEGIAPF